MMVGQKSHLSLQNVKKLGNQEIFTQGEEKKKKKSVKGVCVRREQSGSILLPKTPKKALFLSILIPV